MEQVDGFLGDETLSLASIGDKTPLARELFFTMGDSQERPEEPDDLSRGKEPIDTTTVLCRVVGRKVEHGKEELEGHNNQKTRKGVGLEHQPGTRGDKGAEMTQTNKRGQATKETAKKMP